MTSPEQLKDQPPGRHEMSFVEKAKLVGIGMLLVGSGCGLYQMMSDATTSDHDPDRPPIIVRNGSVIVEERVSPTRGKWIKDPDKRTWYHDHGYTGPARLNAFVVGIANNSCGDGVTNYVSNVKKATFTYALGDETRVIEILRRGNRVEIDVVSGPDPTVVNDWTLSFDAADAKLREAVIEFPSGSETCRFDAGGRVTITQHR